MLRANVHRLVMAGDAPIRREFVERLRRSVVPFLDCAARNGRNPHARNHVGNRLRIASAFSLSASAARAPDLARVVEDTGGCGSGGAN
jgi:hypothetical protein